jgi:hypothetical protein
MSKIESVALIPFIPDKPLFKERALYNFFTMICDIVHGMWANMREVQAEIQEDKKESERAFERMGIPKGISIERMAKIHSLLTHLTQ